MIRAYFIISLLISLYLAGFSSAHAKTATQVCQTLAKKRTDISFDACVKINFSIIPINTKQQPLPIIYKKIPTNPMQEKPNILVLGGVHSNEESGFDLPMKWLNTLIKKNNYLYNWLIAPAISINALTQHQPTRPNINGVDINRNFPFTQSSLDTPLSLWEKLGKKPRHYPGGKPFSEKETLIIDQFVKSFKPDLIITVHAPLDLIDYDGLPQNAPEKLGALPLSLIDSYPGSLGSYYWNTYRIPVLTIELADAKKLPSPIQTAHIWHDLTRWLTKQYYPALLPQDDTSIFNQAMSALSLNKLSQAASLFAKITDKTLQIAAKNNLAYISHLQNKPEQAHKIWQDIIAKQSTSLITVINNYLLTAKNTQSLSALQTIPISVESLEKSKNLEEINWRLQAWQEAWLHSDKNLYFSLYAPDVSPRKNLHYKKWKQRKITQMDNHPLSSLRLEDAQTTITLHNKQAESTFKQLYGIGKDAAIQSSYKKLIWIKNREGWQIQREIIINK